MDRTQLIIFLKKYLRVRAEFKPNGKLEVELYIAEDDRSPEVHLNKTTTQYIDDGLPLLLDTDESSL
jgi:hypothetical protein